MDYTPRRCSIQERIIDLGPLAQRHLNRLPELAWAQNSGLAHFQDLVACHDFAARLFYCDKTLEILGLLPNSGIRYARPELCAHRLSQRHFIVGKGSWYCKSPASK
jgi:hypothetical protein